MEDMDFPLDFKVCFEPARFNKTALKSFGYEDMYSYIRGNNNHTLPDAIGWGGYDNQSVQVKNVTDVLHAVKTDWTKSLVLSKLNIFPHPGYNMNINVSFSSVNFAGVLKLGDTKN